MITEIQTSLMRVGSLRLITSKGSFSRFKKTQLSIVNPKAREKSGSSVNMNKNKGHNPTIFKVDKDAKIRNRYNQVPHLTQDTNAKVTNSQLDTTNKSQEVSSLQGTNNQTRSKALQTQNRKNINDPQKKYRIGTVSENILLKGLNRFQGAKLTLNSDVDQDT